MRIRRNHKQISLVRSLIVPLATVIISGLGIFFIVSMFTRPFTLGLRLPKSITSDALNSQNIVIVVTSENIFYLNGAVATLKDIQNIFSNPATKKRQVVIKADRRASVGRVWDVMDMGRAMGVEKISLATDKDE